MKWFVFYLFCLFIFSNNLFAQNIDIHLLQKINVERNKNADKIMMFFSNSVAPISIASPVGLFVYGSVHKDKLLQQKAILQTIGLTANVILSYSAKEIVQRPRPYLTYNQITPYYIEQGYAMPSMHTSISFYTATFNALQFKKWYVAAPMFLWASGAAYSRMHLGVHYPTDVLAGAVIGAGSAWLSFKLNKFLFRKEVSK